MYTTRRYPRLPTRLRRASRLRVRTLRIRPTLPRRHTGTRHRRKASSRLHLSAHLRATSARCRSVGNTISSAIGIRTLVSDASSGRREDRSHMIRREAVLLQWWMWEELYEEGCIEKASGGS